MSTPLLAADAPPATAPRTASAPPASPVRPPVDLTMLKRLLWFYLALWIAEGALRKWVFPGLATPLLVVRDPFLLLMYAMAAQKGVFPRNAFLAWITGVSIVALMFSLIGSRAPLIVQVFGYRADFMHLPLIFLIPNIFDRDDLLRVGKWVLLTAMPMSLLVLMQFRAGPGARVNVGVGGDGTMLDAGYGHIRASGTFSFTNGLTYFTALTSAFCLYGALEPKAFPRWLRWASFPTLAALVILSASRGVVGMVTIVLLAVLTVSLCTPRYLGSAMKILGVCGFGVLTVGSLAVFRDGLEVFAYRFGSAANVREGFVGRFFNSFLVPFQLYDRVPFYGVGLGMGTNVGSGLLFEGERRFLYAESELGRVMFESGPVVGAMFLLLRVAIVIFLLSQAWRTLRRDHHPLAMLLLAACASELLLGQFGQATTLGFVTIASGLCLAATRPGASETAESVPKRENPLPPLPPPVRPSALPGNGTRMPAPAPHVAVPVVVAPVAPAGAFSRGRSLYAEQMHREAEEKRRMQDAEGRSPEKETDSPA